MAVHAAPTCKPDSLEHDHRSVERPANVADYILRMHEVCGVQRARLQEVLHAHESGEEDPVSLDSNDATVIRRRAMLKQIAESWAAADAWIREQQQDPDQSGLGTVEGGAITPLSAQELEKMLDACTTPEQLQETLQKLTLDMLVYFDGKMQKGKEMMQRIIASRVRSGLRTANHFFWELDRLAGEFCVEKGITNPATMADAVRRSEPFTNIMSASHLAIFDLLTDRVSAGEHFDRQKFQMTDSLAIRPVDAVLQQVLKELEAHPLALKAPSRPWYTKLPKGLRWLRWLFVPGNGGFDIAQMISGRSAMHTGCPAMKVKREDPDHPGHTLKVSVMKEMHDWVLHVAQGWYFPRLAALRATSASAR